MTSPNDTVRVVPIELARYKVLRDYLMSEVPNLDEETLADTLEGITDLHEMLAEIIRSALDDEAMVAGLATRLCDMKARLERLTQRARRKRALVLGVMVEANVPKLTTPDFTASLRQGAPTLDVVAEDRIPAAYWQPQPPKLDRKALLDDLKCGAMVEGALLMPAIKQLSIRTK